MLEKDKLNFLHRFHYGNGSIIALGATGTWLVLKGYIYAKPNARGGMNYGLTDKGKKAIEHMNKD
jgi:hypothetical protein